jgi:hypothetical protein
LVLGLAAVGLLGGCYYDDYAVDYGYPGYPSVSVDSYWGPGFYYGG